MPDAATETPSPIPPPIQGPPVDPPRRVPARRAGLLWAAVRRDYEAGHCVSDLADHYGVNRSTLKSRINRGGWVRRAHPGTAAPATDDSGTDGPDPFSPVAPRDMMPNVWTQAARAIRLGCLQEARRWMALAGQIAALHRSGLVEQSVSPDELEAVPERLPPLPAPQPGPTHPDAPMRPRTHRASAPPRRQFRSQDQYYERDPENPMDRPMRPNFASDASLAPPPSTDAIPDPLKGLSAADLARRLRTVRTEMHKKLRNREAASAEIAEEQTLKARLKSAYNLSA